MIILTENITPRLQYIVKTLFGKNCVITIDIIEFRNTSSSKINYTKTKINVDSLWIVPFGLLEENNIKLQNVERFKWNNLTVFFKTSGSITFDFLSASFYLLSRYEEYFADYKKDNYGNYHHENSIAFKEKFLQLPLINLWLKEIEKQFQFKIQHTSFNIIPTYDIDIAFAYKHHTIKKNIAGLAKDLILKRGTFIERIRTLTNKINDPYNVFDWLENLHKKINVKTFYFFHVAKNRGKFDKNIDRKSKGMKDLINSLSQQNFIGIHPSFKSNEDENILQDEINYLQANSKQTISKSRQHFLQLQFPKTYQTLIKKGIEEDYTLGYGTHNGFRASYCKPFFWYNLMEEKETNLLLHPFCYMDSNSIFEQKLTPQQALAEMLFYCKTTKEVEGNFIFIMHNHFLAKQKVWQDWRIIYENFLTEVSSKYKSYHFE